MTPSSPSPRPLTIGQRGTAEQVDDDESAESDSTRKTPSTIQTTRTNVLNPGVLATGATFQPGKKLCREFSKKTCLEVAMEAHEDGRIPDPVVVHGPVAVAGGDGPTTEACLFLHRNPAAGCVLEGGRVFPARRSRVFSIHVQAIIRPRFSGSAEDPDTRFPSENDASVPCRLIRRNSSNANTPTSGLSSIPASRNSSGLLG